MESINDLDIVVVHSYEPFDWVVRCTNMLPEENVYVVPGKVGRIGESFAYAFSLSDRKYVSFANPDDLYYNVQAFKVCVHILNERPECSFAYTREKRAFVSSEKELHGVIVFRNSLLQKYLHEIVDYEYCYETKHLLWRMLQEGPGIFCPIVGRVWSDHPNQAHKKCSKGDLSRFNNFQAQLSLLTRTNIIHYGGHTLRRVK